MKWNKYSVASIISGIFTAIGAYGVIDLILAFQNGRLSEFAMEQFPRELRLACLQFVIFFMLTLFSYDRYKYSL